MAPPLGLPSRPRWRGLALALVGFVLAPPALPLSPAKAQNAPRTQEDATSSLPPGFEPVDVSEDVANIRARRMQEMETQVGREAYYRNSTPEHRIRSRYGGATWNMYEPFH